MNIALVAESEPIKVETSPSPEMHVIKGVGFLERYEAAGPNGMSPHSTICFNSRVSEDRLESSNLRN